ncbi:unnamed protein product [Pleuronectes platessa]|uniref:Uncharacterized protein n=1 Tax=Pleuronectes platessa TaxID=8262 RepID=A0A9N7Z365_PLEPL|nr:unnamed protein product [Pleuronectes platessa]
MDDAAERWRNPLTSAGSTNRAGRGSESRGRGNRARAGVWERQSQQRGAQQGAEGLVGRMQAKGIVGNYTGLERASNTLIQRDIFIKKQGSDVVQRMWSS